MSYFKISKNGSNAYLVWDEPRQELVATTQEFAHSVELINSKISCLLERENILAKLREGQAIPENLKSTFATYAHAAKDLIFAQNRSTTENELKDTANLYARINALFSFSLENSPRIELTYEELSTRSIEACRNNELTILISLIPKLSSDQINKIAQLAAFEGKVCILELVFDRLNFKNKNECLITAILKERIPVVAFLLTTDASLRYCDDSGWFPLYTAVIIGNLMLVKDLLAKGAPLDFKNKKGTTALHAACMSKEIQDEAKNLEIVSFLLSAGADRKVKDCTGKTPLDWAIESKKVEVIALFN